MCRVRDPGNETKVIEKIVETHFLQRGTQFEDPYLRSIGKWILKDYVSAVNELQQTQANDHMDHFFSHVPEFDLSVKHSQGQDMEHVATKIELHPPVSK